MASLGSPDASGGRVRVARRSILCAITTALAFVLAGCGHSSSTSKFTRAQPYAQKVDTGCATTAQKVAALGAPPAFDGTQMAEAAAYLRREADLVDPGIKRAEAVDVPSKQHDAAATLWADAHALVAQLRAEAQAFARSDEKAARNDRAGVEQAWLKASDDALVLGVVPCGWLVH